MHTLLLVEFRVRLSSDINGHHSYFFWLISDSLSESERIQCSVNTSLVILGKVKIQISCSWQSWCIPDTGNIFRTWFFLALKVWGNSFDESNNFRNKTLMNISFQLFNLCDIPIWKKDLRGMSGCTNVNLLLILKQVTHFSLTSSCPFLIVWYFRVLIVFYQLNIKKFTVAFVQKYNRFRFQMHLVTCGILVLRLKKSLALFEYTGTQPNSARK